MRKKVTSGLLLGLMSLAGVSIYDDYLIYQQCSKYVKHFHVLSLPQISSSQLGVLLVMMMVGCFCCGFI
jgi:hypothetical protein